MNGKELSKKVNEFLIRNGRGSKERLAAQAGVSARLIDGVKAGHLPKAVNIVAILQAMGEPVPESVFNGESVPA